MTTPEGAARTAIVTVDDDAGVSRAVARDLRRRYGEQHRIVRAESGDAALDALREMRLRGDEVAVILADYRMPGMNGIEFLERAMDLYPAARRVLLTAYADTGAAIDAINVVDLDHYLLKPWDPPEEKLYPVVDELLEQVARGGAAAGPCDQGGRAPLVGPLLRGPRVPRPQPDRLPLVRLRGTRGPAAAGGGRGRRAQAAGGDHPRRQLLVEPTDAELAAASAWPPPRRRISTTSSSSAAARPAWAPRSTARPRGCAPCWWSAPPPAARRARARGSRTTSASRTGCPGRS